MTLCHFCNHAFSSGTPNRGKDVPIHNTFQSFLAAVDEGCYVCQGLFRQAPDEWKQELRRRVQIYGSSAEERPTAKSSQRELTKHNRPDPKSRYGCVSLNLGWIVLKADASLHVLERPKPALLEVYPVAAEPLLWNLTSPTTNSEETFTKIKAWLDKCGKTHIKCRVRRHQADVGWQPTRLVEVAPEPRTSGHADNTRCRLIELGSENIPQNLKYVTLSHRWPQNLQGFQKLTVDKLPLWKDNLPTETLSQTFRDAFLVAYRLGISYVWIDSLCIIQDGDDYADWRKEAPLMHKVYSNAEFNICAAKNNQVEHYRGLFSSREPPSPQPLLVKLPMVDDDKECNGSGHILIREGHVEMDKIWAASMNDSPLNSRGWVFQEQLLSRANVHFGDQEVLFECSEMRASESMGSDQDYGKSVTSHTYLKEHLPIRDATKGGLVTSSVDKFCWEYDYHEFSGANYDEYAPWHNLLSQYTALQLTKSDDRLVALSGVARYFKKLFSHDDYYIGGLWRSRLPTEMLWQLTRASPREGWEKRKKTHLYLTFSWLSVEGTVENQVDTSNTIIRTLAELEPIKYRSSPEAMDAIGGEGQPFAEDIFSLPIAPTVEIRVTGLLRPVSLKRIEPASSTERQKWPGIQWNENPEGLDLLLDPLGKRRCLEGRARLDFEISPSEVTALNKSGRLFLMPLIGTEEWETWTLLLELLETSDGEDMGRFRRVGVHQHQHYGSVDKWLAEYMPPDDLFSKLPCWRYDDFSKQHTIFVV